MGQMYTVKPGDYLSKIASEHGFADIGKIVQDEHNRKYFSERDPNILFPGDRIFIPDKENKKQAPCQTDMKHFFRLITGKKDRVSLHFIYSDTGQDAPMDQYLLKIGSVEYHRSLNDPAYQNNLNSGLMDEEIPNHAIEADLSVAFQAEKAITHEYHLLIGSLDPATTVSGIQARLNNLGYDCGKVDGFKGPKTGKAIKQFQTHHGLKVDGLAGPITQAKLKELHGS